MLVNMNDVLYPAKKGKYAVGLFNAVNLDHWKRFPIILFLWLRKQMFR